MDDRGRAVLPKGYVQNRRRKPKRENEAPRRVPSRPLVLAPKPKPTGVFAGPRVEQEAPYRTVERAAKARARRAQGRLYGSTVPGVQRVPDIELNHRQRRQVIRQAQRVSHAARVAGIDVEDAAAHGDRATRAFFAKAREALRQEQEQTDFRVGLGAVRADPTRYGITSHRQLRGLHEAIVAGRLPRHVRRQIAGIGSAIGARTRVAAKAGRGDRTLNAGLATINVDALGRAVLSHTSLGSNTPETQFVRNALNDVGTLASAPFVGAVQVGRAGYDLAHGDSDRAVQLGKGLVEGVKQSVPGRLVSGDAEGAVQQFRQHPLLSALDVAGATAIAGRGAGALARVGGDLRRGGVRGTLGRAGSTVRPPLALTDDGTGIVERTYSKDLTRKAAQVAADRRRQPVRDRRGRVVTVVQRGREVPVLKMSARERGRYARRSADFAASRANSVERLVREQADRASRIKGVRGKSAKDIVAMAIEGTITSAAHMERDLRAHRDRLQAEYERRIAQGGYRHSAEAKANRDRVALVDRVLSSPRALKQAEAVMRSAETQARRLNAGERSVREAGLLALPEDAARRAALIPAAIEHLGARHFTEAEHRKLERDALKVEQQARKAFREAEGEQQRNVALRALSEARQQRIAVSGRDPRGVQQHEMAAALAAQTRAAHERATREVAQLERSRQRLLGRQEVQGGQEAARRMAAAREAPSRAAAVLRYIDEAIQDPRAFNERARRARKREEVRGKVERRLRAARAAEKQARARRVDAERRLRESPMPPIRAGVRTGEGRHLPTEDIEKFLRSRGRDPESVSYLPHRLDVRGARAFHSQLRPGSRPVLDKQSRTGEAYRKGATESSAELVRDHAVRQAVQLAKAQALDALVADFGTRHPAWAKSQGGGQLSRAERRVVDAGGYFTAREAVELADRLHKDTGEQFVPMRAFGAKLPAELQQAIREGQDPRAFEGLDARLLNDRIVKAGDTSGARNVVLMPAELVEQLERHVRPAGPLLRFLQTLNRPFRMAVLPQPRWLTGNFVEPFLVRLPLSGSGVVNLPGMAADLAAARKVLKRMERSSDPKMRAAAQQLQAQQLGGLLIGNRGASVHRPLAEVGGPLGSPLALATVVRRLPVVKQIADFATAPLDAFFRANRIVEGVAQRTALGKSIRRDVQEFEQSWRASIKLGKRAADEAARGLLNTPTQQRYMRAQHTLLGQYEGFSPAVREAVQSVAPFMPWALSAARFTFWTLPINHTATTAMLVKSSEVFGKQWAAEHSDAPPGELEQALRTRDGGFVDVARYTPWGLSVPLSAGEWQSITDQFMPQISGVVAALEGHDPFGRPLRVDPHGGDRTGRATPGQELGIALNALAEAMVPYVATVRRLREGGGTGYADSTAVSPKVKPGTSHMSAPRRTFDPFRPTYLRGRPAHGKAPKRSAAAFDPAEFARQAMQDTRPNSDAAGFDPGAFVRDALRGH